MAENFDDDFEVEMLDFKAEMLDFKDQMIRFAEIAGQKFDGLAFDVRGNSIRLDKVEQRLENVEGKVGKLSVDVRQLSGQFRDVARKVMDNHTHVEALDERVTTLEAEAH